MIVENKLNFYIGTITHVENDPLGLLKKDKLFHEAVVTIPGVAENVLVFPGRNQIDEPKVGDLVVVCSWDPVYNSYCTYEKLKENDFVGFRAHGKMVQINHDEITIGVFDESETYKDDNVPDVSKLASMKMTKDGEIKVHAKSDITVDADSNVTITIKGNANVKVDGNAELKVSGNVSIKGSKNINVEASSTLTTKGKTWVGNNGTVAGTGTGPFCSIPICPLVNIPHVGNESSGGS
jgi:hypothetical protein